jgi:hypothetical protein
MKGKAPFGRLDSSWSQSGAKVIANPAEAVRYVTNYLATFI